MEKTSKEAYTLKQQLLASKYGAERKAWEGCHRDDRAIFCAVYDMLMEACEAMKGIENNFICVAFNEHYKEEMEILARISERFKGREEV
jgi:hypothetical protein